MNLYFHLLSVSSHIISGIFDDFAHFKPFVAYLWTFPAFLIYSGYVICQTIDRRRILQTFGLPIPSHEIGPFDTGKFIRIFLSVVCFYNFSRECLFSGNKGAFL